MTVQKAAAAGAWSAVDLAARQVVQFGVSIILARLLTPEDFGVIAILIFFSSFSTVFLQSGLSVALIQRQTTTHEEETAFFWLNLSVALIFGILLGVIGGPVARFYETPVLEPLMWVAAGQILLTALAAVHAALLTRSLEFRKLALIGLSSSLVSGAVGVTAALLGWGIWALAAQMLSGAAVVAIVTWIVCRWRPGLRFRPTALRPLFGFASWVSLGSILDVLYTHGFSLLVGKLYGARDLGLYNRAQSTQLLPSSVLSQIIGRIALPIFSARGSEPEALARGLRMAIGFSMLLNLPIMAGLALLSEEVILVLFGEQWVSCAPILSILALGGMLAPVHLLNLQMILAQGLGQMFIKNELAKKCVGILCVAVGSLFGIYGLAIGQIVFSAVAVLLNAQPARRLFNYGPLKQLGDLAGLFLCTGVMSAAVYAAHRLLRLEPATLIVICVLIGATTFILTAALFKVRSFVDAQRLFLESALRKKAARAAGPRA